VKRQLAAFGVEMTLEQVDQQEMARRGSTGQYEAMLTELIGGPNLLRPYMVWHSKAPANWGGFGNDAVDAALDRVRHAPDEETYRDAVRNLQQTFLEDPPAIFLAWSVRARAVSTNFSVPETERGRDVFSAPMLRLWKPASGQRYASRK
jgi:ABC-type transport system substrate-binding protein